MPLCATQRLDQRAACALLLAACALAAPAQAREVLQRYAFSRPQMGTEARIVLYAADAASAERGAEAGFARMHQLDAVLSDYRQDSELQHLVHHAGRGARCVSEDLFVVLQAAQTLAVRSGGAFDAARGAVTHVWRQARRLDEQPDPTRLQAALGAGDHRDVQLHAQTRRVTLARPGLQLDLGGIAKGYVADQALEAVRNAGVSRAFVGLGGDLALGAPPPGQAGWQVDIAPLDVPGAPPAVRLQLHDVAVSTAGDAEQWMEIDGVRQSHVIDARDGRPLTFRSTTTVIAPRGLQADGLDTAASVLGPHAGVALVDGTPGSAVLMIRQNADGQVQRHASAHWPENTHLSTMPLEHPGDADDHT